MRYYLDENLSPRIARLARGLGVDIVSTHELGRTGASDAEQLSFAAAQGRCLITLDSLDLLRETRQFYAAAKPHGGVLIIPWRVERAEFGLVARLIARFTFEHPEGLQPYEVRWLSRSAGA